MYNIFLSYIYVCIHIYKRYTRLDKPYLARSGFTDRCAIPRREERIIIRGTRERREIGEILQKIPLATFLLIVRFQFLIFDKFNVHYFRNNLFIIFTLLHFDLKNFIPFLYPKIIACLNNSNYNLDIFFYIAELLFLTFQIGFFDFRISSTICRYTRKRE